MENKTKSTDLRTENAELKSKVTELELLVKYYEELLRLAKHRKFGASSEKSQYDDDCGQLSLFNEAEASADANVPEPELREVQRHYRKNRRLVNGDSLPDNLQIEVVEHNLPEEEQVCPECGGELHVMGREKRRELKSVPAKVVIVEHVRKVYACRNCEKDECGVPILKAPVDEPVIKGSFASPEAIAHIMVQKFCMAAPLYRQEQDWNRQGIAISRQTMSNWLLKTTEDWLKPVYDAYREILLQHKVLHADEATLQVLHEPGKAPQSKSYMWLYRTSGDSRHPIVLYEYRPDRKAKHPAEFLDGVEGYLHTDGYEAYQSLLKDVTIVGCFAHARRKWDEALKSMPKHEREGSNVFLGKRFCDQLFELERQFAGLAPEERFQHRQELAKPVLDDFRTWLENLNTMPKSPLGIAAGYTLGQWKHLEKYLLDGRLEISNNRAERSIKPFVIGRKNFLFANTTRGANASAIMFSIIETAKENGLNPFEYLAYMLRRLPNLDIRNPNHLDLFMPWNVPDLCRVNGFVCSI